MSHLLWRPGDCLLDLMGLDLEFDLWRLGVGGVWSLELDLAGLRKLDLAGLLNVGLPLDLVNCRALLACTRAISDFLSARIRFCR